MSDFMLRTDTEDEMDAALEAASLLVEQDIGEGEMLLVSAPGITLDRIGPIPPKYDQDGNVTTPGDIRYHANLRATIELTQAQEFALPTFTPEPSVPYRVFL